MSHKLTGLLHYTESGLASYDISDAKAEFVIVLVSALRSRFPAISIGKPIQGLDGVYINAQHDNVKFVIGWDIWTGCFIFARDNAANPFVSDISEIVADFL